MKCARSESQKREASVATNGRDDRALIQNEPLNAVHLDAIGARNILASVTPSTAARENFTGK